MPINLNFKPANLAEAVAHIVDNLVEEEIKFIREHGVSILHHHTGMLIRNNWDMWCPTSKISEYFKQTYGLTHADDMSGLILYGVGEIVNGRVPDYNAEAQIYHNHWASFSK